MESDAENEYIDYIVTLLHRRKHYRHRLYELFGQIEREFETVYAHNILCECCSHALGYRTLLCSTRQMRHTRRASARGGRGRTRTAVFGCGRTHEHAHTRPIHVHTAHHYTQNTQNGAHPRQDTRRHARPSPMGTARAAGRQSIRAELQGEWNNCAMHALSVL